MQRINTGQPFDCTYTKRRGQLVEFTGIKKHISADNEVPAHQRAVNHSKRRTANSYESLVPFVLPDGSIRELYTRLIVKFNQEEVAL